jgi:hypothetical protein
VDYAVYLVFAAAFFFLSAHLLFMSSDNLWRPAGVNLPGFALAGFADAALTLAFACEFEDPASKLRAEVSLAISASSSRTILAISI